MKDLLEEQYQKDNYLIKENQVSNSYCYIYCSSNAIYEKDNKDSFQKEIVDSNRYEWTSLKSKELPAKEIWIRDIYLSWYVKGINQEISTYEKLISFLREETKGYTVRTAGASSGGFIAGILAMELHAEYAYSFSGQFSLQNHFDHLTVNPYLVEHLKENGEKWVEYYRRLKDEHSTRVIYIYPNQSEQDVIQASLVKDYSNICSIAVCDFNHGVVLEPYALPYFLCYSWDEAKKLAEHTGMSRRQCSIKIAGRSELIKYQIARIKRKLFK